MSASAQAIIPPPPAIPASKNLLPVPTQVQILAAFVAALGTGWVVLAVLFVYRFRQYVAEEEMAQRIAHRLATTRKLSQQQPREFFDDVFLKELAIFNRPKEEQ
ncbi:hypothetical protein PG996_008407 [Apiospora saccharicola]|uniref:Uncharacterized protein n=1 Tax=Apiospora saccharicola TaxID=335842 RepID=A0ABR1V0C5_9PEZI